MKRQTAPRAGRSPDGTVARRLARLEAAVGKQTRSRVNVRREEHDQVLAALRQLEQHTKDLDAQFKRIAQMQADLDEIKRASEKAKPLS